MLSFSLSLGINSAPPARAANFFPPLRVLGNFDLGVAQRRTTGEKGAFHRVCYRD